MDLSEFREVDLWVRGEKGSTRFIVADVSDGEGGKKRVIRGQAFHNKHREIVEYLQGEAVSAGTPRGVVRNAVACCGGGFLELDSVAKTITLWGRSQNYGKEPDRQETIYILERKYSDYRVTDRDQIGGGK